MKLLSLLFLLLVSSSCFSAQEYAKPRFYLSGFPDNFYDTQEAACSSGAPRQVANNGTLISAIVSYPGGRNLLGTCWIKSTPYNSTGTSVSNLNVLAQHSCPAGYLLGAANQTNIYQRTCTIAACPTGTTLNTATNQCEDNCLPMKGKMGSFGLNCSAGTSSGQGVCMPNNCAAVIVDTTSVFVTSCYYGINTARYSGEGCSGQPSAASFSNPTNAPDPTDKPETDCVRKGQSFGYVNGVPVCVPKGSASAAPVTQTNQSTTTTTNTDSAGNSTSNTSTETKNATQDGDQVTSQTIKTNPDGTKTEETKTEPVYQFCASNPTHPICKKPASEDEEGEDSCEDNPDLPRCMKVGEAEEGDNLTTDARTINFSPVTITSGGSCPADKSVSIAGKSITFSYTWLCNYASMFKPFMLAFAYLSAAMFLFMGLRGANS
ncbi:MAG: virulence factor TspB C-terminal domain-related protein [Methylophilus sp.]